MPAAPSADSTTATDETPAFAGVDFTSAPSPRKPLTIAHGEEQRRAHAHELHIHRLDAAPDYAPLRKLLHASYPLLLGLDAPLSLPRAFVREHRPYTPGEDRKTFVARVAAFAASRPVGHKEPRRACDVAAGALSPVKRINPPLAAMYHTARQLLAQAPARVLPWDVAQAGTTAVVLETYPGALARALLGNRTPYKGARADAEVRRTLLERLSCTWAVRMEPSIHAACVEDPLGDVLDAVLCCVLVWRAWTTGEVAALHTPDAPTLEGHIYGLNRHEEL